MNYLLITNVIYDIWLDNGTRKVLNRSRSLITNVTENRVSKIHMYRKLQKYVSLNFNLIFLFFFMRTFSVKDYIILICVRFLIFLLLLLKYSWIASGTSFLLFLKYRKNIICRSMAIKRVNWPWQIVIISYSYLILQFQVFKRCFTDCEIIMFLFLFIST